MWHNLNNTEMEPYTERIREKVLDLIIVFAFVTIWNFHKFHSYNTDVSVLYLISAEIYDRVSALKLTKMSRLMWKWYLSHMQTVTAQASLHIRKSLTRAIAVRWQDIGS